MKRVWKWSLLVLSALVLCLLAIGAFGFYRVYYGRHVYETVAPELPAQLREPAVLVFSKTNGFRDDDAVNAANAALRKIAERRGWSIFFTENGAVMNPAQLHRFQVTVWNNTTGDLLTIDQRAAFQNYIDNGGGFVGIHGAGGDPHYDWRWYVETLIGAQFKGHPLGPQFQPATVHVEAPDDPAMQGLYKDWTRVDEWYSFEKSPRSIHGVKVLATLDESTYSPKMVWKDIRMGADHPIVWKHCVNKGRGFYSALGHSAATYQEAAHLKMLEGGIAWAAGLAGDLCGQ